MVSATEPAPPLVEHLVYFAGGRLTLKQARRGTLLIGGGWPARVDDRTGRLLTDFAGLAENLRFAIEVVPEVAGSSLLRTWQGVCPGLADERPAIGELVPGFVVALFPYLGFTCGPLTGRLAAQPRPRRGRRASTSARSRRRVCCERRVAAAGPPTGSGLNGGAGREPVLLAECGCPSAAPRASARTLAQ